VGRTPADLRQDEVEITRWTAVEDELKAMLKGVSAANLIRRHRLGLAALQAYNISQQLVRHPDHADLLPHVEGMKRLNKFGRRRAKAPVEPPPVEPPVAPQRQRRTREGGGRARPWRARPFCLDLTPKEKRFGDVSHYM